MSTRAKSAGSAAERHRVLVLGGGPDAERDVSLASSKAVADALKETERFDVSRVVIDRLNQAELAALPGTVIFPVLHGGWGEGGPLQDLLEKDGRPFVGSCARAARHAMDKIAAKDTAVRHSITTCEVFILDPRDPACPLDLPVVIKPVHEGSTIGLYVCATPAEWDAALAAIRDEAARGMCRTYMIEPRIRGRELTVGILDDKPLPIIEITPGGDLYDYQAKYHSNQTRYTVGPSLPPGAERTVQSAAVRLASALNVRHIARADFILDQSGTAWLLEINTMPGFTDHSLVPMAARSIGMEMPDLCAALVDMALRDRTSPAAHSAAAACGAS